MNTKLKQYVLIQQNKQDEHFKNSYCCPKLGMPSGVSPEKYVVRVEGRAEQYLTPENIEKMYSNTHTIVYFDHISELLTLNAGAKAFFALAYSVKHSDVK